MDIQMVIWFSIEGLRHKYYNKSTDEMDIALKISHEGR